ncbi:3-methyl-2-oxobutanoate hydroxymethyltransferase [Desulfitispora alkaliphila]|uniref:3-methyl-2-oxobutanoate hydroxymethyltransferase n=1 Tax=Desulfitispora alkaliphila TaxID=622674 RepID=UPI003D1EEE97
MAKKKLSVLDFKRMKTDGEKITMVTAYDYTSGILAEQAGIEMILVGDSLGMTMLGYDSTVPVTMEDMVHHTKATVRGAENTFVVADLPYMSYEISPIDAMRNGGRLIKEGGADAVKLEGGSQRVEAVKAMTQAGIPVVGHLGLTPQTATQLGGYKVQGRGQEEAEAILQDAEKLTEAGIIALVLECVPAELAKKVTEIVSVPTIGIGAGVGCDGQVLVYHDMLGIYKKISPKFVKVYADLSEEIVKALSEYKREVKEGQFPGEEHSF